MSNLVVRERSGIPCNLALYASPRKFHRHERVIGLEPLSKSGKVCTFENWTSAHSILSADLRYSRWIIPEMLMCWQLMQSRDLNQAHQLSFSGRSSTRYMVTRTCWGRPSTASFLQDLKLSETQNRRLEVQTNLLDEFNNTHLELFDFTSPVLSSSE